MVFFWPLGKKKKRQIDVSMQQAVPVKNLSYPPKIILAWAKALEGHEQLALFLKENGYQELNMASAAIRLNDEARDWLMKNGYPHLMAMIHAAEGNASAQKWLKDNKFELLYQIAMAVEDEQSAWAWLKHHGAQDLFLLAQSIKRVKDDIELNHNDIHSFGRD